MEPKIPSLGNLDLFPSEIIEKFLLQLNFGDISNWCQVSQKANEFCQNESFWKDKYQQDFPPLTALADNDIWRMKYRRLALSRNFSPFSAVSPDTYHLIQPGIFGIIDDKNILSMLGTNMSFQLGFETDKCYSSVPVHPLLVKVISVSCADLFTGAITEDGKCYLWGRPYKILGRNNSIPKPQEFSLPGKGIQISCYQGDEGGIPGQIMAILLEDESVYFSGYFPNIGHNVSHHLKVRAKIVYAGYDFIAYIDIGGKLYFWGCPFFSEKCDMNKMIPVMYPFPGKIREISFSEKSLNILATDGSVYHVGLNKEGQMGLSYDEDDEDEEYEWKELRKISLPPISHIYSSINQSLAITRGGRLIIWGSSQDFTLFVVSGEIVITPKYLEFREFKEFKTGIVDAVISRDLLILTEDGIINHVKVNQT